MILLFLFLKAFRIVGFVLDLWMHLRLFRLEYLSLSLSLTQHFKPKQNQNDANPLILSIYEHDKKRQKHSRFCMKTTADIEILDEIFLCEGSFIQNHLLAHLYLLCQPSIPLYGK